MDNSQIAGSLKTSPIPVLVLFGPTASGKTAILKRIFTSRDDLQAEIISADSMQVYKGMDIGTAKPSLEERALLPHHLIDICDPSQQFNAGDFVRLADEAVWQIAQNGKLPVISGGTGFYLKNFIMGLSDAPPSSQEIRDQLKLELKEKGINNLMEELSACDPVSTSRIHFNDEYRLLRALEVFRTSGCPLSSYPVNKEKKRDKYRFLIIGLTRQREEIYSRINMRCAEMFKQGLADEVNTLFDAGYTPDDPGMRAIGYREFFVEAEEPASWQLSKDIEGVQALIAQNSRRYAKRQYTFFAGIPDINWIDAGDNDEETAQIINQVIKDFLNDR